MVEAVILPYLNEVELLKFSSLNTYCRGMFTLGNPKCINFMNIIEPIISAEIGDSEDDGFDFYSKVERCETFFEAL